MFFYIKVYFADVVGSSLPGNAMEICPPHVHIHLQLSNKTGNLDILSIPPGAHGAGITGIQGIGVNTPIAAAVADATVGFAIDRHIPKGGIFTIGLLSMIFPMARLLFNFGRNGSTTENVDGVIPNEHCNIAP